MYYCKDISLSDFMGLGTVKKIDNLSHLTHSTNHFVQPNNPLNHPTQNSALTINKDVTIDINHPNTIIPNNSNPSTIPQNNVQNPVNYAMPPNPYYYYPPQQFQQPHTNFNQPPVHYQQPPFQYKNQQQPAYYNNPPSRNDNQTDEYVEFKTKNGKSVRFKPKKNKTVRSQKPLEEIKKEFDNKIINEQTNVENIPK